MSLSLRPYQNECIDIIDKLEPGAYLIQMATGLGKTFTFSQINRKGKMLILSHREELVTQPRKYFDCSFGIELRDVHSNGEEVVSASTLTMTAKQRYKKFAPEYFDIIVIDEAHHSAAKTYRELIEYFKPRLLLGFTATPNRADGVRLDDIYSEIIYKKDIKWGIENGYLSNIECLRINIGYDLSNVGTYMKDYKVKDLEKALRNTEKAVIDTYKKYARGATLIFTVSVEQAEKISAGIPNSVVVTAKTKDRDKIIEKFTNREIDCIVNCMVFTEGTDIPLCETVIIARPTKSNTLYTQMVGRGLRIYVGKQKLRLIDCVGQTENGSLCTAPSLLGLDISLLDNEKQNLIQGDILDLPEKVYKECDCPASWIRSCEYIKLWADDNNYNLHGVNWIQLPDGSLTITIPKNPIVNRNKAKTFNLPCPDELGCTKIYGRKMEMQAALNMFTDLFYNTCRDVEYIWNTKKAQNTWGKAPASEKQKSIIKRSGKDLQGLDFNNLTKFEASLIISRLFSE